MLGGSRSEFIQTVNLDDTLKHCQEDADSLLNGYEWENGLLMREQSEDLGEPVELIVVPKPKRAQIVLYAHNHMGHFSVKKTLALVR